MPSLDKIEQDLKQAMLAKDEVRLSVLRMLKSAVKYVAIEKKGAVDEGQVTQVIQKQIKQRQESIQQFVSGGRKDLAAKEEQELRVLESYLPKQIPDEELKKIVAEAVKSEGAADKKDFGRLMKLLSQKLAGSADNKRLSQILGESLK